MLDAATTSRLDALLAGLKASGHRLTPQRVAIVRELVERDDHPSVEQLHAAILPAYPTTSLATVYKTIHLLKVRGEVLELSFGELGSRYDGRHPEPHPHLICTACGAITDPDGGAESLAEMVRQLAALAEHAGFAVSAHRFDLFGLCARCRPKG